MKDLPLDLQSLVYWAIGHLGASIRKEYGESLYHKVEALRQQMKDIRTRSEDESFRILKDELSKLDGLSDSELFQIAHSFGIMLELINRCETSYRSFRLQSKKTEKFSTLPERVMFVFTAHPTEARSKATLELFSKLNSLLTEAISKERSPDLGHELEFYLTLLLKLPLGKEKKPEVSDEANHLYSIILEKNILDEQIRFFEKGIEINFRSWVGGDKDGHPGVDDKTMKMSFQKSRDKIFDYFNEKLNELKQILKIANLPFEKDISLFQKKYHSLKTVTIGEGALLKELVSDVDKLLSKFKMNPPELLKIKSLCWLYPALVVPLELREDSELVHKATQNHEMSISKMLDYLSKLSESFNPKWYGRGLILSNCEESSDLTAGLNLVKKHLGSYAIPVVPLFESKNALDHATKILDEYYEKNQEVILKHKKEWGSRFELMLGYSDSSKESGVLFSRYTIWKELHVIDKYFKEKELKPVFFHGSGGSIERGGGAVKEQTAGWPESALKLFKATVQGEMIVRNFSNPLIMKSQIEKIVEGLNLHEDSVVPESKLLDKFILSTVKEYQTKIGEKDFKEFVLPSTPYDFLDVLKIGSRPSKRGGGERKLRAIPWVLCWTQTRVLFPTWWGVGKCFYALSESERLKLKEIFNATPVMQNYLKVLGFTLKKIELPVWKMYLTQRVSNEKKALEIYQEFKQELEKAHEFFKFMTEEEDYLWFRPWLGKSVYFRSCMIHPINLIQLVALKRKNGPLLRETVTGIACGMLTTG